MSRTKRLRRSRGSRPRSEPSSTTVCPSRLPLDLKTVAQLRGALSAARIAAASRSCRLAGIWTRAVPTVVVEEFPSAWAQEWKDVLEVGRGARRSAKCCRIERSSPCGEEKDARQAAADLGPTRVKVSVWNPVAGDVENRA